MDRRERAEWMNRFSRLEGAPCVSSARLSGAMIVHELSTDIAKEMVLPAACDVQRPSATKQSELIMMASCVGARNGETQCLETDSLSERARGGGSSRAQHGEAQINARVADAGLIDRASLSAIFSNATTAAGSANKLNCGQTALARAGVVAMSLGMVGAVKVTADFSAIFAEGDLK